MDPIKTFTIGTDYKDRKVPLAWEMRLFAELVFVDKTHDSSTPLLYQLKENTVCLEELAQWKNSSAFFPKDSFLQLGEVVSIDKKKKQILLSNQNVVGYRYLVIASGSTPVVTVYGDEFTAGINALIDALRMKAKIPSSFADPTKTVEKATTAQEITIEEHNQQMDKVVQPSLHAAASPSQGGDLNSINKRLYEVQL